MADRLPATVYAAAENLLSHTRSALMGEARVRPRWLDDGARFWYRVDGRFVLVDPVAGTREPAFDHARLAAALAEAAGQQVDAGELPFRAIEPGAGTVAFVAFGQRWRCDLGDYTCLPEPAPALGTVPEPEPEPAADPAATAEPAVPSPDGKLAVFRRGHDLWARSMTDGREWPLTTDGAADHDYGGSGFGPGTLLARFGVTPPPTVAWSPDSTRVLTSRVDVREVRQTHLVQAMPADGGAPRLFSQRSAYPGDEHIPMAELVVLEVATGAVVRGRGAPLPMPLISPVASGAAWWAVDGAVYYLSQPRDLRTLSLHRLDPATGEVQTVVSETGETRVQVAPLPFDPPLVRLVRDGAELLWYSERDGRGHLYRYDRAGRLLGRVTSGDWEVRRILHVDEDAAVVYFLAAGLVEADPYRRSVCRAGLDGTGFALVTEDELDHVVTVPEHGGYFLDSASTVELPPVTTVRDWSGRVLVELERGDLPTSWAAGWTPPERFRTTAADGHTPIYGVLYRPRDFDPAKRYPVIDSVYPGPQATRVEPSFGPGALDTHVASLTALGFVVVAVDGRGTPGRGRAFHDHSYGRLGDAGGLADHLTAIRELAVTRPWLDLDRVGVCGISGGGYATVRAMCAYPEFYRAGVAINGMQDNRYYLQVWGESFDGPYDEQTYARSSNVEIADRLTGELLLIHGGSDDNVHPHHTLRLVDRLIAEDKDFELVIVPGAEHMFLGYEHYLARRLWDHFVRHLLGVQPPARYRLKPTPLDLETLAEQFS
ncbi:prolyl oligopeptidase family serine peptidase [Crossiella sp. SN42]|uniref:S9 family peptidase n=1 Tax=Crossiella sp. SN42 TaxID=2944808 RepID=UPI00207C573A|nr:prolyl oligopeptidase family serine peptidase [Crossiella sp. SN42]MCO1578336.1 prolyl oligopeptidase family serine peptidase [Crossiella sp. SN42]